MNTPEGRVKAAVRKLLDQYEGLWTHWPVPSGYGRRTIDCFGCYRGRFFGIETKAPGKKPTINQTDELQAIDAAMGQTFVIDRVDSPALEDLRQWLNFVGRMVPNDPLITPDSVARRTI
jgi:hypothetical protein